MMERIYFLKKGGIENDGENKKIKKNQVQKKMERIKLMKKEL